MGTPLTIFSGVWLSRLSLPQAQECLARLIAAENIKITPPFNEGWRLKRDGRDYLVEVDNVPHPGTGFCCHLSHSRLLDPLFLFDFLGGLAPAEVEVLPNFGPSGPEPSAWNFEYDSVDYWSDPDYSPPHPRFVNDYWSNANYSPPRPQFDAAHARYVAEDWETALEELRALRTARAEAEAEAEAKVKAEAAEAEAKAKADAKT